MGTIQTQSFVSRDSDSVTLRVGRDMRVFRPIIFTDEAGEPMDEICLVEMSGARPPTVNEGRLSKIMQLMEDGMQYRKMNGDKSASLQSDIQPKARQGDYIRADGATSKVVKVSEVDGGYQYELDDGRCLGEQDFVTEDVLLESEVF